MDHINTSIAGDQHKSAVSLLQQLISVASFSRDEAGAASVVAGFLGTQGVAVNEVKNNIWAVNQYFDPQKQTILLNSHIDTVKPNKDYTRDPFSAAIEDGRLFGVGSNDAGGCLVALIHTFLHFYQRSDLRYNLMLAATAEEEISGPDGISLLLAHCPEIAFGIVGEPTLMQLATAEKGLLVLDCVAPGRSGHAARQEGVNAIYQAIDDINWFRHFTFPKVSPLLGPVKMSVTLIQAGTQHNVVPATCTYTVDVRINECYSHEEILATVRENVVSAVQPRSLRLKSTSIDIDHPLVQAGVKLGLRPFGSATMSDKALMPFPALKIGPGDSARSHMADEFIYLQELSDGITIYIQLLSSIL